MGSVIGVTSVSLTNYRLVLDNFWFLCISFVFTIVLVGFVIVSRSILDTPTFVTVKVLVIMVVVMVMLVIAVYIREFGVGSRGGGRQEELVFV